MVVSDHGFIDILIVCPLIDWFVARGNHWLNVYSDLERFRYELYYLLLSFNHDSD